MEQVVWTAGQEQQAKMGCQVFLAPRVREGHQGFQDLLVPLGHQEQRETLEPRDSKASKDHQVSKELMAFKELLEKLEAAGSQEKRVPLDLLDPRELWVQMDYLEWLGHLAIQDLLDPWGPQASRDQQDNRAVLVLLDL